MELVLSLEDFIAKWQGRGIDFDGAYGDQCMDLIHMYHFEVLGITNGKTLAAPTARDVFNNFENIYNHELFEKVINTPTNIPQKGDIVIWGSDPSGHIAVFVEGDVSRFKSLDQNWPTGSKCQLVEHTYNNVLGWLHFKGNAELKTFHQVQQELASQMAATTSCQTQLRQATENASLLQEQVNSYISKIAEYSTEIESNKKDYEELQRSVVDLKNEITKIHQADSDYVTESMDAQKNEQIAKEYLYMIADELLGKNTYETTDDKALVEELLSELHQLQVKQTQDVYQPLITIAKQLESMGINNYLKGQDLPPIDTNNPDATFPEKVVLYLTALTNELLSLNEKQLNQAVGVQTVSTITPPKKRPFRTGLVKLVRLFFVTG